jgi:DNA-directed RNA polymerase specialized sigma subunit
LGELSARQRAILGAYYGDGGTLTEIAALLHLTPAQAAAEHAAALDTLRAALVRNVSISGLTLVFFQGRSEPGERAA